MPVYNTAKYLNEAINSILEQTFKDFEFIIIDDCSTDGSKDIIKSYNDERIILIENESNKGIIFGLNFAISIARGKYIARMDSDDISVSNRFELQYLFLEKNSSIICCGASRTIINEEGIEIGVKESIQNPDLLKLSMLFNCVVAHPTVFIRSDFIKSNNLYYNYEMEAAEDYDLWCKILEYGQISNLKEKLLKYRIHSEQISQVKGELQLTNSLKIRERFIHALIGSSDMTFEILPKVITYPVYLSFNELHLFATQSKYFIRVITKKCNNKNIKYLKTEFSIIYFRSINKYNFKLLLFHLFTPFVSLNIINLKFAVKCLIGWRTKL